MANGLKGLSTHGNHSQPTDSAENGPTVALVGDRQLRWSRWKS